MRMHAEGFAKLRRSCDLGTGFLIYFAVVFSPWALGTTDQWSMRLMNWVGWTAGALLVIKCLLRVFAGVAVQRWGAEHTSAIGTWLLRTIAVISLFLVVWGLVSAWNASAVYSAQELQFTYRDHIKWLPHSFDARSSWRYFRNYFALACFFWALIDWLLTKNDATQLPGKLRGRTLPSRLRILLWVLSINGALVALEGLIQRLSGTGKLLWLVQPLVNPDGESQFGPYAYRSNAAQFFNLVWPVTLGFWFVLHHWRRRTEKAATTHHLLLSCVMLMAACPLVSESRAGAVVTVGLLVASGFLLVAASRGEPVLFRAALAGFTVLILVLGLNMGWGSLRTRMSSLDVDYQGREEIYSTARKMATEYPWFGTGPGTFDALFQMYRRSPEQYWPAQLHNDWLETRITFGQICFSLLLLALALAAVRWSVPGGIRTPWAFPAFIGLALAGCLVHARVDFPLQIYSILLVFLLECAVLLCISRQA